MVSGDATLLNTGNCKNDTNAFGIWFELIRHSMSSNYGILSPRFDRCGFDVITPCDIASLCLASG